MKQSHIFFGEVIGTFILVFIGCGSISLAIIYGYLSSLYEVATFWTIGVTLAIYASSKLSNAHLNPAVSIAFLIDKQINLKDFINYLLSQLTGAALAGLLLINLIKNDVLDHNLSTASIFGEYYPNPSFESTHSWVTTPIALTSEIIATFLLIYTIFWLIKIKKLAPYTPILIGITVGILIYITAPLTQCCMNPARDIAPRVISYFYGWQDIAFINNGYGWLIVYIIAPLIGGASGAIVHKHFHSKFFQ